MDSTGQTVILINAFEVDFRFVNIARVDSSWAWQQAVSTRRSRAARCPSKRLPGCTRSCARTGRRTPTGPAGAFAQAIQQPEFQHAAQAMPFAWHPSLYEVVRD